jgi:hypothetical protein
MFKKIMLGALPTFVVGIAIMTLAAPQQAGVSLDHVATLVKHASPSHASSHQAHTPNKPAHNNHRVEKNNANSIGQPDPAGQDHQAYWHGYRGYGYGYGYHGYRGYRGWRSYHGYHSYYASDIDESDDQE